MLFYIHYKNFSGDNMLANSFGGKMIRYPASALADDKEIQRKR